VLLAHILLPLENKSNVIYQVTDNCSSFSQQN